jgi:purine-binding chemotaxis protein CheW
MNETEKTQAVDRQEHIAFRVGEQEFCVEITSTREIRGWSQATRIPHSPDYIIGVINLRGSVLPIMDLSARLSMGFSDPSERHVIIVVKVDEQVMGLLVDSVSDILDVGPDDVRAVPERGLSTEKEMFSRVIVFEDRIISEISLEAIMPEVELKAA